MEIVTIRILTKIQMNLGLRGMYVDPCLSSVVKMFSIT